MLTRNADEFTVLTTLEDDDLVIVVRGDRYYAITKEDFLALFTVEDAGLTINLQTASYVLALSDANNIVEMAVAGANTLTIPANATVAFPVGTVVTVAQTGAGQVTLTPAVGVTLLHRNGLKLGGQEAVASIYKSATNTWRAGGDLVV